ncbi:MAG: hypothetical protein H7A23_10390 [Leptospiraceae bacterium]|nr:hypothetical protein [Leptospiraceae bacterium]MCP5494952.1 hypothetical protein [Leptospiraceae bacterium]
MINRLILFLIFFPFTLFADSYHNIQSFIGEKAAAMGGAFTAISDDPSGAYYNPAGISFAYNNYVSISANTYREIGKPTRMCLVEDRTIHESLKHFHQAFLAPLRSLENIQLL